MKEGRVSYLSTSCLRRPAGQTLPPSQRGRDENSAGSAVLLPDHREWCDPRGSGSLHVKYTLSSWGSFCHSIWKPLSGARARGILFDMH